MFVRMLWASLLVTTAVLPAAAMDYFPSDLRIALSGDAETAEKAIANLRARGYLGLRSLLAVYDRTKDRLADVVIRDQVRQLSEELAALERVIDQVAGQKHAVASRLYWHTDLEQAKSVARSEGKPILCLRLLGQLTDEFSCANSRFFRTTLYANAELSAYLRENYILYWKTVRPVPKVTIDFGDGRKLERTLTGNSVHYVLDLEGRPIEALPGLYGPQAFLEGIKRAQMLFSALGEAKDSARRDALLVEYHAMRSRELLRAWQRDLAAVAPQLDATRPSSAEEPATLVAPEDLKRLDPSPPAENPPSATAAGPRAMTKAFLEMPILRGIAATPDRLEAATTDDLWLKIAARHAAESRLDDGSKAVIRRQNPTAARAGRLAVTKARVEDPLVRLVQSLESAIALDTVKNEYLFHLQIHDWFVAGQVQQLDELNERVYAQLFLTPSSDPWLGLMSGDAYSALENDGVVHETLVPGRGDATTPSSSN